MSAIKENLQSVQKRLSSKEFSSKWEKILSIATFVGAIGAAALSHRKAKSRVSRRTKSKTKVN